MYDVFGAVSYEEMSVAFDDEEKSDGQAAVLCDDGTPGDAGYIPMEDDDEQEAECDVDKVKCDGNPHGQFAVLESDEPTFDSIESQSGWGRPDAYEKICGC